MKYAPAIEFSGSTRALACRVWRPIPGRGYTAERRAGPPKPRRRGAAAFTLAEVLAALAFMAIVIPVAVEGVRVANSAGVVALRKGTAARVAERVLNETIVTGHSQSRVGGGTILEGAQQYRWSVRNGPWPEDAMRLVTAQVVFAIQGKDYEVDVSTLLPPSQ